VIETVACKPLVSEIVSVHVPGATALTPSEPLAGPLVVAIPLQPLTVNGPE
jgi:hypothetical protein